MNLGNTLVPVGSDDAHSGKTVGLAWVMVGAEKLEYGAIMDALEKGDLYASTGPEIYELSIEDGKLHIECSDAQRITIETGCRFAKAITPKEPDKLVRGGTVDISPWLDACTFDDPHNWLRVVVHGPYGQYASTRGYRVDELK